MGPPDHNGPITDTKMPLPAKLMSVGGTSTAVMASATTFFLRNYITITSFDEKLAGRKSGREAWDLSFTTADTRHCSVPMHRLGILLHSKCRDWHLKAIKSRKICLHVLFLVLLKP